MGDALEFNPSWDKETGHYSAFEKLSKKMKREVETSSLSREFGKVLGKVTLQVREKHHVVGYLTGIDKVAQLSDRSLPPNWTRKISETTKGKKPYYVNTVTRKWSTTKPKKRRRLPTIRGVSPVMLRLLDDIYRANGLELQ